MPRPGNNPENVQPGDAPAGGGALAQPVARNVGELPKAPFDPMAAGPDADCWAHDETVEPGKVYRYRVRYFLRNPVHAQPNAVDPKKPELSATFALVADWSEWSGDVTIAPRVRYFVSSRVGPTGGPGWRVLVRCQTPEQAKELVAIRGHIVRGVETAAVPPATTTRPTTCPVCGYSLQGLGRGREPVSCPECGTVAVEPTGDSGLAELRASHPSLVRRMVVLAAVLAVVVAVLSSVILLR
jgi:hypothetical protein